jgi:DNA-binding SARP family transcriptional activator
VLALLALRPGKVVSTGRIIDELWGTRPPRSASTAVQTYVYQLRRSIGSCVANSSAKEVLVTVDPGYVLDVDAAAVDVFEFRDKVQEARKISARSASEASALLAETLAMVDGAPLGDVRQGTALQGDSAWIDEQLIAAQQLKISLTRQLGMYEAAIVDLRLLLAAYPFVESFHVDLVDALHRVGRRSDAIRAYHDYRSSLQGELGIDPTQSAQDLYLRIISSDASEMDG